MNVNVIFDVTTREIYKVILQDNISVETVNLNTSVDEEKLNKVFMKYSPGTEISYSEIPYVTEEYLLIISTNGYSYYKPETIAIFNFNAINDFLGLSNNLASENNPKVHSKYIVNEQSHLELNPLWTEPTVTVPDIGQKVEPTKKNHK